MAKHDDGFLARIPQQIQTAPDQASSDTLPLMNWKHSHRSQRNGRNRAVSRVDKHAAEKDVPHSLLPYLGNQRKQHIPLLAQLVHQIGFVGPPKGRLINVPDTRQLICIIGVFAADDRINRGRQRFNLQSYLPLSISGKRILDAESRDLLACVHILGEKNGGSGLER